MCPSYLAGVSARWFGRALPCLCATFVAIQYFFGHVRFAILVPTCHWSLSGGADTPDDCSIQRTKPSPTPTGNPNENDTACKVRRGHHGGPLRLPADGGHVSRHSAARRLRQPGAGCHPAAGNAPDARRGVER